MKVMRKIIEIDEKLCNGCGQCIPECAEGALEIVDHKARLVAEKYCDGLGACLGDCPTGALRVIERQADDFDAAAVETRLHGIKAGAAPMEQPGCGCASAQVQTFISPAKAAVVQPDAVGTADATSELSQWPVKIRLVPPTAPFLKGADLLLAADCTPQAYPTFHRDFLAGRVLLSGCPKFDDIHGYIKKLAEIFQTAGPRSITILIMEVPCCGGMRMLVSEALKLAEVAVPVEDVVISVRGEITHRQQWDVHGD